MNLRKVSTLAFAATLAALAAGCENKPAFQAMPEANDENCTPANIQKLIEDNAMRKEFAGKCARRGTFKSSEPKNW